MSRKRIACCLLAVAVATGRASAEEATLLDPPPAPFTLWNFLGITQSFNKVRDVSSNRSGNFPGMERKPPRLALADPKNLQSQNPAIKKAAEIKAAEDLAPQKIKALKYLARMGCGCYDLDGKVTEAFIAALDDCTEEVRFQAAISIMDAAANHCQTCGQNCCCNPDITAKLAKIAYERNDKCCCLEPSARVREAARDALMICCQNGAPRPMMPEQPEPTGPAGETIPTPTPPEGGETIPSSAMRRLPGTQPFPPAASPGDASAQAASSAQNSAARPQPTARPAAVAATPEQQPASQTTVAPSTRGPRPQPVAPTAAAVSPVEQQAAVQAEPAPASRAARPQRRARSAASAAVPDLSSAIQAALASFDVNRASSQPTPMKAERQAASTSKPADVEQQPTPAPVAAPARGTSKNVKAGKKQNRPTIRSERVVAAAIAPSVPAAPQASASQTPSSQTPSSQMPSRPAAAPQASVPEAPTPKPEAPAPKMVAPVMAAPAVSAQMVVVPVVTSQRMSIQANGDAADGSTVARLKLVQ